MKIEAQDDLWECVEEEKERQCFLPGVALLGGIMLHNRLYHCTRLHLKLPRKKGITLICEVRCVIV